jgi:hypothetical protein
MTSLERNRIAGTPNIPPPAGVMTAARMDGRDRIVGTFKLCIDTAGIVVSVGEIRSTGYPEYDALLMAGMQTWAYQPWIENGQATAVCAAIAFLAKL